MTPAALESSLRDGAHALGLSLSDAQVAGIPMVAQGQIVDEAPETGFYQAPTLLRDVPVNHRLAQDEVFGPVLSAMALRSL